MASVTINGNGYSDDGTKSRDMRNGGHRQWLLPMLNDLMVASQQLATVTAGGLSKITVTAGGSAVDNTAAGLHVRGNASDGSQGVTVDSYAPTVALIDRTPATTSFRLKSDAGYLRFETDNADNGATWNAYSAAFGSYGNFLLGEGTASPSVGLYLRNSKLTGTTQWGMYSLPVIDPLVASSAVRSIQAGVSIADMAGAIADVAAVVAAAPSVGAAASVGVYAGLRAENVAASNVTTVYGCRLRQAVGTDRWNLYADGAASNHLAGTVLIGTTTDNGTDKLQVNGGAYFSDDLRIAVAPGVLPGSGNTTTGVCIDAGFSSYFSRAGSAAAYFNVTAATGSTGIVRFHVDGAVVSQVDADGAYKVGANKVVGARKTGWSAMTGTAARTAAATHTAQTIGASYTQSQVQNLDNSLVIVSQRLKALIDDLTTHGLIGA